MKWSHNGSSYYASAWNGTERYFLFSIFINVSPLILAWNEAIIVFYNFFSFYAIFFLFSITCRVGTEQNNNFYFLSFLAFLNLFLLQMMWNWYSSNFLNFFAAICLEFSIAHWVGMKRNDNFYFFSFSAFSSLFWLEMKT